MGRLQSATWLYKAYSNLGYPLREHVVYFERQQALARAGRADARIEKLKNSV